MVKVFTRASCAFCPMVKKYLAYKQIPYEELPAEGEEYMNLAIKYGGTVPLVINGDKGMVGYNIPQLNQVLDI